MSELQHDDGYDEYDEGDPKLIPADLLDDPDDAGPEPTPEQLREERRARRKENRHRAKQDRRTGISTFPPPDGKHDGYQRSQREVIPSQNQTLRPPQPIPGSWRGADSPPSRMDHQSAKYPFAPPMPSDFGQASGYGREPTVLANNNNTFDTGRQYGAYPPQPQYGNNIPPSGWSPTPSVNYAPEQYYGGPPVDNRSNSMMYGSFQPQQQYGNYNGSGGPNSVAPPNQSYAAQQSQGRQPSGLYPSAASYSPSVPVTQYNDGSANSNSYEQGSRVPTSRNSYSQRNTYYSGQQPPYGG